MSNRPEQCSVCLDWFRDGLYECPNKGSESSHVWCERCDNQLGHITVGLRPIVDLTGDHMRLIWEDEKDRAWERQCPVCNEFLFNLIDEEQSQILPSPVPTPQNSDTDDSDGDDAPLPKPLPNPGLCRIVSGHLVPMTPRTPVIDQPMSPVLLEASETDEEEVELPQTPGWSTPVQETSMEIDLPDMDSQPDLTSWFGTIFKI